MCLNHPKAIPAQSLEKLSSMKLVPGAKKVWGLLCYVINSVQSVPYFGSLRTSSCSFPVNIHSSQTLPLDKGTDLPVLGFVYPLAFKSAFR